MAGVQKPTIVITAYADITTDITADVMFPLENKGRGMAGNGPNDRLASTGMMDFDMDNHSTIGRYLPGHSNCLAGWKKGTPVEIAFTYDGNTVTERWYVLKCQMAGTIEERIHVALVDWLDYPANHTITNPDYLENATIDEGITEVTTALAIQPQDTDLDVGTITFPALLDTVSGKQRAMREYSKLVGSEPFSNMYLQKPEVLRFENMLSRNGTRSLSTIPIHSDDADILITEAGDTLITEAGDTLVVGDFVETEISTATAGQIRRYEDENGQNIINRYPSRYHPRRMDEESILLYEPEQPISIAAGERKQISIYYFDQNSKQPVNAVPPASQDYTRVVLNFEGDKQFPTVLYDIFGREFTCNGGVQIETDFFSVSPPVGTQGVYFDGTAAYLTAADSPHWDFGTNDFTISWWEFRFNTTSGKTSFSRDSTAAFPAFRIGRSDGTNLLIDMSSAGASNDIANGKSLGVITTGEFVHLEVGRSGTTFYAFKNGVQTDTWTSAAALNPSSSVLYIARHSTNYLAAGMDRIVIVNGNCLHTSAFTPPTSPHELNGMYIDGWTNNDFTGTEITSSLSASIDYRSGGAELDITNNSINNGSLFIKVYGYGVHLDSAPEYIAADAVSEAEFGTIEGRSDLPYSQDSHLSELEAPRIVEEEREGRTVLHRVDMNANVSSAAMMRFLYGDIGSLVHTAIEATEKDAWFWVQRYGYKISPGKIIDYWWLLREHYSLQKGLDDLAVEFAGGSATDCITFPYMPYVCGDDVTSFSISLWFYQDTQASAHSYFLAGPWSVDSGVQIYIPNHATDRIIGFYSTRFAAADGLWTIPANQYSLSAWVHLVVTYSLFSSSDPVIYINGVSQTVNEDSPPSGALTSGAGNSFSIGNTPVYGFSNAHDGKIKDVQVYRNTILSQANVDTLYNSGTHSPTVGYDIDGLVFQAFAVKSSRYAAYQDLTLTSTTRLIDAYLGIVGTPNGSPIARVP